MSPRPPPTLEEVLATVRAFALAFLPGTPRALAIDLGDAVPSFRAPLLPAGRSGGNVAGVLAGRSALCLRILLAVSCSPAGAKAERLAELAGEPYSSAFRTILADLADPEGRVLVSGRQGYAQHADAHVTPRSVWEAMSEANRHTLSPSLLSLAEAAGLPID